MRPLLLLTLLLALSLIGGCGLNYHCLLPPSITGQPSSQAVALGQPASFTVAASGSPPLYYQWLKNGIVIPGANQPSYLTSVATSTDSGSSYTVAISNALGALVSLPASLTISSSPPATIRFVAPDGNDSNAGTQTQPYRTIQHCATAVAAGWTCEVRAGIYHETITPNSGVTITSYNLESVAVDGSDPITNWTLDHDSVYKATTTLNADDTNQLFVGGEMMTEARWPNGDDLFSVNWARAQSGTDTGHIVDAKLPSLDWTGAKIHLWSGSDPFSHETGNVTASAAGQITIAVNQTGTCPYICPAANGYYYLFGTLQALDAAREWFYDPSSTTVYFMAPGGVDPNTLDVRGKRRQYAFDLRGKTGVTIRNIGIFASTIATDQSSANNMVDRINAQYVSHFTTLPTDPTDPSGSGFSILFVHNGDSGIIINGTGNTVQNSTIAYSAGAGIALEGNSNIIRNNLIHHVDYIGNYASGINLDGNGNIVQHNSIDTAGRQAILMSGVINEDISYNNLFNSMIFSRDGAEIYACCLQSASETRIHHNWLHDTQSLIGGAGDTYALSGIGIDNGSAGFVVDQNVLWNNQRYNILINGITNGPTNDNQIRNNTVPDSSSRGRIAISNVPDCTPTSVVDNRVAVSVQLISNNTACNVSNNRAIAPGATEMSTSTGVGCNFAGCSSDGPPAIFDGGIVSPCPVSVFAQP